MGSKSQDSTSTQSVSYPKYITDAQKAVITNANTAISPLLGKSQTQLVADQTPQQQQAATYAGQAANSAFNGTNYADLISKAGANTIDPTKTGYQATTVDPSQTGYTAKDVSGGDITALMSPYTQNVIQPTLDNMRREYNADDAKIGAQNASSVAFGGSGAALQRAQAGRDYQANVGSTVGNLLNNAYSAASGLASQNASADNAASASSASDKLQSLLSNQNAQNTAGANNAGQSLQALLANQQIGLTGAVDASNASSQSLANQQAALASLLGIGNANQTYNQSVLDAPRTAASWYSQFVPGVQGSTSTTTPIYTNPLSTALGGATLAKTLGLLA